MNLSDVSTFLDLQKKAHDHKLKIITNDNLCLITYIKTRDNDFTDDFVRTATGTIIDVTDMSIVCPSFPKTPEINIGLDRETTNVLSDPGVAGEIKTQLVSFITDPDVRTEQLVDGTLIRMWFNAGEWRLSTNRGIDAFKVFWSSSKSFGILFDETCAALKFEWREYAKKDMALFFVIQHPEIHNTFEFQRPTLYHIASFVKTSSKTWKEIDYDVGIPKPQKYESDLHLYAHTPGWIFVHTKLFFRLKIMSSRYLYFKKIKGNQPNLSLRFIELLALTSLHNNNDYINNFFACFSQDVYKNGFEIIKKQLVGFCNDLVRHPHSPVFIEYKIKHMPSETIYHFVLRMYDYAFILEQIQTYIV